MRRRAWLGFLALALIALPASAGAAPPLPAVIEFNRDIRPILSDNCYACHGPDKNQRKAKLRLDKEADAYADRGGYAAIAPGKPDKSEVLKRIATRDVQERMPPAKFGKKLTARQVELLRRWIAQGAKWQKHWSLLPARRTPLPAVAGKAWPRNPIDRHILARLEQQGLHPAPEADRRALIRRLSFDLLGLPPTAAEVDAFVNDRRPDAYEKVVKRLLASEHFGERMALYWLDVVRYADTGGYHSDNHRNVYLYRDYVINAFNRNKHFDRFTIEQLAGDLLPGATTEQRIASGYNRLLQTTEEGGAQAKEYTAKYQSDRVRNTATAWLGLTLGCTECHDHKFDPFRTKEFYQLGAFFADVQQVAVGRQPDARISTPRQEARLRQFDKDIADLGKNPTKPEAKKRLAELKRQKAELEKTIPTTLVSQAGAPRMVRMLPRGNWLDDTGPIVEPGTPASLPPLGVSGRRATRLDLAKWLASPDNPLTARVFVNRMWKLMFGQGIVRTLDDFGSQGAAPTHPELLDYLAVEFVASGWDVKHLLELMVTSATYRQSSKASDELRQRDPNNRLLARQARFRLDAEMVRDNALAVSGLLVPKIGGPSVKPYQPAGYWSFLNFPRRQWVHDRGDNQYRRGLYTYWQRTFLHPSLLAFDASTREECTVERPRSNTPLQALVLLNDPTYVEAARALAERVLRRTTFPGRPSRPDDLGWSSYVEAGIQRAYRRVLARRARPEEVQVLAALYRRHLGQYQADRKAAEALLKTGDRPLPRDRDLATLAAWTSVTRTLLNLHETITRN